MSVNMMVYVNGLNEFPYFNRLEERTWCYIFTNQLNRALESER